MTTTRPNNQRGAAAVAGLLTLATVSTAARAAEYAVFDLGPLTNTADGRSASVSAVSASLQVSLTDAPDGATYRAFRYAGGAATSLGTLGGANSYAASINAAGQVVGRSDAASGVTHAYVWTPGGTGGVAGNPQMKDLTPAGGASQATAINATGQVAGYLAVPRPGQDPADRAFLYSAGTLTQLPLPTGGFSLSYAYGVNDAGRVVGAAYTALSPIPHGFLYNGSTSVEIPGLGGVGSTPLAINKNDRVVGYTSTADGYDHAFVYAAGTVADLGTLGGHYSYANAINGNDQVVGGSFVDDADNVYHAFTSDGATMTDLNAKVTSRAADWVLEEASGVNDAGVIVGNGSLSGARHGFLLRPLAAGDANADGRVDFADLVALAQHYNTVGGNAWEQGDFSGDGNVDFTDLVALAQNYNTIQFGASPGAVAASGDFTADVQAAFAIVPEPGGLIGVAGAVVICVASAGRTARGVRRRRAGIDLTARPPAERTVRLPKCVSPADADDSDDARACLTRWRARRPTRCLARGPFLGTRSSPSHAPRDSMAGTITQPNPGGLPAR
jgi:probable HAF family extracellular repeat protein